MNLSDRKKTYLREMGVDVWQLRRPASARDQKIPIEQAVSPQPTERALRHGSTHQPETAPPVERPSVPAAASKAPAIPPFSVVCLAKGDVLLLIDPGQTKAALRFALDLLSAASGIWGGELDQLSFDWPQPGIDNNAASRNRALGAFLAKQIGDRVPSLVLMGQEVADRLEHTPDDCLILPPLGALMTQGELKRELWARLTGRQ